MSTTLRQVLQIDFTGDMVWHTILRCAPILLFPLSITHFIILVTVGKDVSVERKRMMTKTWPRMFGDQNHGDFSWIEWDTLLCLTLPALYIMHCVVGVSDLKNMIVNLTQDWFQ
jgi:hypothetical protein